MMKKSEIKYFPFPDTPREKQYELINSLIETDMKFSVICAATGIGKTAAALVSALNLKDKYLDIDNHEWEQIFYLTPKHSQRKIIINTIKRINRLNNLDLKILDWKPKNRTCLIAGDCNYRKCGYIRKYIRFVNKATSTDEPILPNTSIWDEETVLNFSQLEGICPYYAQKYLAPYADILILDYNHIYAGIFPVPDGLLRHGILIVDEAQNLPDRVRDYYNFSISLSEVKRFPEVFIKLKELMKPILYSDIKVGKNGFISTLPKEISEREQKRIDNFLYNLSIIKEQYPEFSEEFESSLRQISQKEKLFSYSDMSLDEKKITELKLAIIDALDFLKYYFDDNSVIKPFERILRFFRYWQNYASSDATIRYWTKSDGDLLLTLKRIEVGDIIFSRSDDYCRVIFQSATLYPLDFYIHEFGLDDIRENLFVGIYSSPFPEENRFIRIIPHMKLTYDIWSEKDGAMRLTASIIGDIMKSIPRGRVGVFCASSGMCEKIIRHLKNYTQRNIFYVPARVKTFEKERVLQRFFNEDNAILITPQGGALTEGVDYSGDKLISAFIVGIPIVKYDENHQIVQEYYKKMYGTELGFLYSTIYPAVAKSVQAAGRVIRTEKDRGCIFFMDKRWGWHMYNHSMPREWYRDNPKELIINNISLLKKQVEEFYKIDKSAIL